MRSLSDRKKYRETGKYNGKYYSFSGRITKRDYKKSIRTG